MTTAARLQVVVEADVSKAESGLQSLGQKVMSFGQSFAMGMGISAGVEAMQAGLGLISGSFGQLKSSVIDFNQQLDQSRAVFARYFDGNTEKADQFLNTLKGFAAATPFEFKDLSQLAIRLQNANTNANDIIPTIKAIGNAASASGSLSQASLDRITLALTQMQMKGKVTGEEMLQLVEAGVPAWNLLAEATGKPIPVLQEMASKGQISADVLISAFRGAYENAGLMEGASKSLEGALSTIRDVGTQAFADIGRSVYDLATQGANQLATFLSSDAFQTWANAARVGVESVVGGIKGLLDTLAPVGQTIAQAFVQFTAGDFGGGFSTITAGIQTALGTAVESVQAFAQQMFGAGANLVSELAGGIAEGASSILQGAIDMVASTIAAFLIGNSPPPEGPLARIREGGANVIAAWGEGAADAADQAVKPAADKIAGGLDELKVAGRGVDESIREIGRSISDLDSQTRDLKSTIDDVKDGYKDQLDPLEQQLKALTERTNYEAEEQALLFQLEESSLKRAENEAQGSREVRARIDDQIEELNLQKQALQNAAKREELERKARGDRSEAEQRLESLRDAGRGRDENPLIRQLQDRLESLRDSVVSRPKSDAERRLDALRSASRSGGSNSALDDEREQLRVQEARLKLSEQQAKIDARAGKGEDVTHDRQQLALDQQQLELSIKEYAAKKTAAAEEQQRQQQIAALEAQVRKEKEQSDKAEEARKKNIQAVEKQIADAKRKDQDDERTRQREIAALEKTVREEKRQGQMAEAERGRQLAGIDGQILTLNQQKADLVDKPKMAAIRDAQAELKERKAIFETAQREEKLRRDIAALPIKQQIAEIKAEQEATLKPLQDQVDSLNRQKGELSEQRQHWQSVKQEITAATQAIKDQEAATKSAAKAAEEAAKNAPRPAIDKAFTPDALAEGAIAKAKESGEKLATNLKDGFIGWITANPLITGATIAGALFGAGQGAALGASLGSVVPVIGTAIGGVLGAGIGAAIGGIAAGQLAAQLQAKIEQIVGAPLIATLAARFSDLNRAFNEGGFGGIVTAAVRLLGDAVPRIAEQLGRWANALADWATQAAPKLFNGLQTIIEGVYAWIGTNAGPIGTRLTAWATALVGWVGTGGLELLSKLADLGGKVLEWVGANATRLAGKLVDWATAFVAWVGPEIPRLLTELGTMLARLVEWLGSNTGKVLDAIGKWAVEFVAWVGPKIPPLLVELGKLLVELTGWVAGTALPAIAGKLLEWGAAIVEWVGPRVGPLLQELGSLLLSVTGWIITEALPAIASKLAEWGLAFVTWVAPKVGDLLVELGKLGSAVGQWIADQVNPTAPNNIPVQLGKWAGAFLAWVAKDVLPTLPEKLGAIIVAIGGWVTQKVGEIATTVQSVGAAMLEGITQGIGQKVNDFKDWLKTNFVDLLPNWLKEMLGIHSPSALMVPIGSALIDGIIKGMEDRVPLLKNVLGGIQGMVGGGGGISAPEGYWSDLVRRIGDSVGGFGDLLAKQLAVESINYKPSVISGEERSHAGARGIAQFMPGTAEMVARQLGVSIEDFWESPELQIRGAARHMKDLLDMFGGDVRAALVGYNAGAGNAQQWLRAGGSLDWLAENISESRLYLHKILGLANGGIVMPQPGGVPAILAEAGRPEAVIPLPSDWRSGASRFGAPTETHRFVIQDPSGRTLEEWYVKGREMAISRRRVPVGAL